MNSYLVLTIIGDDKPGLVEQLAKVVADNSGNWLQSHMSQLAGKFAGILQVSVPDANAEQLIADLNKLSGSLKLVIERVKPDAPTAPLRTLVMNLVGNDRPGIIKEVSRVLARAGVNVEDLETECAPAPMSSDILFRANAVLKVATDTDLDNLRKELERIADDLIVEIQLA